MPRFEGATYFDLKGGLNTESSPLNIPPTDAVSVENIDINIDGSITRRRAIDFLGTASNGNIYQDSPIADYATTFVGDKAEVPSIAQFNPVDVDGALAKYVTVHLGNTFRFYRYNSPVALREIDLPEQVITSVSSTEQALYKTIFLSDRQRLYVVNPKIPFAYMEYDSAAAPGAKLGPGLLADPVKFRDDSDGATSVITNAAATGDGWPAGALSGSRIWLGGTASRPNTVYFSQTIVDGTEYSKMYQEADPFDATDNQLVDTDGGSIQLTGAEKIIAIAPFNGGVIVFANNGVWSISGQDGFRPTSYSINKISDIGIIGSQCWTEMEQQLVFYGTTNIYTIVAGNSIETPEVVPVGDKITTFYNSIPLYNRTAGKAVYSPDRKKLYFYTNFEAQTWQAALNPNKQNTMSRDVLVLDVRLAAWTKYRLSEDTVGTSVAIGDAAVFDGGKLSLQNVIDNSGNNVVDNSANQVVAQDPRVTDSELVTNLLFLKKSGTTWKVAFGEMVTTGLTDFVTSNEGDAEDNAGHITMAHQLFKDIAHKKFTPYMIPIFERIESGVLDENDEDITPGGCKYRVDWNWAINASSTRFGVLRDAYFPYKYTTARFDGVEQGTDIVTSKLKIRGHGDVMRLHFESDGSKDFKLLGWQLMLHAKGRV